MFFEMIIRLSWNCDTCSPSLKPIYNKDNPSMGQCAVTSLIINDYLGGK